MGNTSVCPIRPFSCQRHYCATLTKIGVLPLIIPSVVGSVGSMGLVCFVGSVENPHLTHWTHLTHLTHTASQWQGAALQNKIPRNLEEYRKGQE